MEKFSSAFTASTLIDADTVACVANSIIKLGEYQVPAGEELSIGYEQHSAQDTAVGRAYFDLKDGAGTPAVIPGMIRLTVYSPQNRPLRVLYEWRTEKAGQGASDMTLRIPVPESPYNIREDQKLVLEFIADAAATLTKANCTILLDVTKYVV
jgi:hypothetical protein